MSAAAPGCSSALCGITSMMSLVQAELIQSNMHEVDAAIEAVASLVASGMDWTEVGTVVKEERKKGNPVAELILSLDLEKVRNSSLFDFALLPQKMLRDLTWR